ncbi:MAG TPA: DUF190 domain-containing protein [Bacteroidota bacterium]|nr:DUF190 domain-containing protein [Bacteroidota bacterium]
MKLEGEGKLLRIFIGEADRSEGRPLYEAIVRRAREHGMAGVTVLRGVEGFGARSHLHTAKIVRLSEDLPIVVELVDTEEKMRGFMPLLDALIEKSGSGGLITLERAEVIWYGHGGAPVK